MNKEFWKAALVRAIRTVAQTLGSTLPVGVPVTVSMVKGFDMSVVWAALAWLATGLLAGVASVLTSLATGLPEVQIEQNQPPDEDPHITIKAYADYDEAGNPIEDGGGEDA